MAHTELEELARRVETADAIDIELNDAIMKALHASFPNAAAAILISEGILASTDAIVALVTLALPGWHFSISGWALSDVGPWHCLLRRSDVLDDDEVLGIGEAHRLNLAVLAALIRVATRR